MTAPSNQGGNFTPGPKVLDWLLEESNPSVRNLTLTDILKRPESGREVKKTRKDIIKSPTVCAILSRQKEDGCWEAPNRFYSAKYRGTVWQLIILAELGVDAGDPRVEKACEFILRHSQEPETGGFSMNSGRSGEGLKSRVIPCLTGNMVFSLIRCGYLEDPRVQRGIDWITVYQRFDDAIESAPRGWPYDQWEMCWGRHTCHMGVVKSLKALAEIPSGRRSKAVRRTIEQGAEFMLRHHVFKSSHNPDRVAKPGWRRFGFPLMYQTDALEILGILTRLGYRDNRMKEAVDLMVSKQDRNGRWKLDNTYNGRYQVNIEQKGRASKWVTLNALRALKLYYGDDAGSDVTLNQEPAGS